MQAHATACVSVLWGCRHSRHRHSLHSRLSRAAVKFVVLEKYNNFFLLKSDVHLARSTNQTCQVTYKNTYNTL